VFAFPVEAALMFRESIEQLSKKAMFLINLTLDFGQEA
jgi:hypothetical protein